MNRDFDAVKWMRDRREEIDREDEGLSGEERTRKTLEILRGDPLWEWLKDRRVEAKSPVPRETAAGQRRTGYGSP
jgi:hypothetical protein